MVTSLARMGQIRERTAAALADFLAGQGGQLGEIGPELGSWLDTVGELLAGGKRLRPAFCYWGWRAAGGGDCAQIHVAAAAIELLHASALVHDDVIDASDTRRGQPAVHRRFAALHEAGRWRGCAESFGAGAAILIGDLLLAWTDQLYSGSGLPAGALARGRPVLDAMRAEVICGQYLDLLAQNDGDGSVDSALRVVRFKSAKYTIERPLQLGVALAEPPDAGRLMAACTAYGLPLGAAFQLRDDLLGVFGDPEQTGKPAGDDLREGKQTALVAIARQRASAAQRGVLARCLGDRSLRPGDAEDVRAILTQTGAVAECERMIDSGVADALRALADAPFTDEARAALAELATAATARSRLARAGHLRSFPVVITAESDQDPELER